MRTLNLGILAHVDAGKTSLTERLLYAAGIIDRIGSVDDGNTQTDTLALERRRGITIRSAVASFTMGDALINLIDTPGHPDFIAEVERVLHTLDGAVLVISAVEGVQAQTRVLYRTLRRLEIPTLLFVNKVDRPGAREDDLLVEIGDRLTGSIVAMTIVTERGSHQAQVHDAWERPRFAARVAEVLAEHDEQVLARYVHDEDLSDARLRRVLATATATAQVHPVYFGSAVTGVGLGALRQALTTMLPAAARDPGADLSASVFKIERGAAGEKVAYLAVTSGAIRLRSRVGGHAEVVTGLDVIDGADDAPAIEVPAGRIAKVRGLHSLRIGDRIGEQGTPTDQQHFAPPALEALVEPLDPADRGRMHTALTRLAEADPLIGLRTATGGEDVMVSLYGQVQQEVIADTLADEFGVPVRFSRATTLHIEEVVGAGCAVELMKGGDNPFLATIGLRIEPAPRGTGVRFELEVEPGAMPSAFFTAVAETVDDTLAQGLYGWEITDAVVTMTRSGYAARQGRRGVAFDPSISSSAGDFRHLTPLVLMEALRNARTRVLEPIHSFRLEAPRDTLPGVYSELARVGAVPLQAGGQGSDEVLTGDIPATQVDTLRKALAALTRGEGVLESEFDRYQPVRGQAPRRIRTGPDPLDREKYLLELTRRVAAKERP